MIQTAVASNMVNTMESNTKKGMKAMAEIAGAAGTCITALIENGVTTVIAGVDAINTMVA